MTKDEALKLALEALQFALHVGFDESSGGQIKKGEKAYQQHRAAITTIKEALAQPAQEPAGWMCSAFDGKPCEQSNHDECENPTPLYTKSPKREWVGLTDEEICLAWLVITDPISLGDKFQTSEEIREFVRSIEAKLKEKNNG
jgi:hypothetical protein